MDRRAAQRRKLLQPPPTDIVELLNDIAAALDNMNETSPGADDDWIKTEIKETAAEIHETAKNIDRKCATSDPDPRDTD